MTAVKGNILEIKSGIIVHQVNCQRKAGKGLALQIRNKWPKWYEAYLQYDPKPIERLACASTAGSENAPIQVFCARTSKQTFSELAIALEIILRCRTFSPGVFEQKEGKWTRAGESQKFESTEGC